MNRLLLDEQIDVRVYEAERAAYPWLDISLEMPHWIISHVVVGQVETKTGNYKALATPGTVMVHPKGIPFSEVNPNPGVHEYFAFEAFRFPHGELLRQIPVDLCFPLDNPSEFSSVFGEMLAERGFSRLACVLRLIHLTIKAWEASGSKARPAEVLGNDPRLSKVVRYMQANYPAKLTRDELAAMINLHPGYFDRVFRAAYGVPPMTMLRDLRLREVRKRLIETDATVDSIAIQCGLTDAAHLSRVFRAQFQLAPGQFRSSSKRTSQGYMSF